MAWWRTCRRLNWCASQVRGRLSAGCWQAVLSLQQQLHEGVVAREAPRQTLDRLLLALAALAGFSLDDMTQDAGWRLLRIGRRLERLQFVARLLSRHLAAATANQHGHVEWLLTRLRQPADLPTALCAQRRGWVRRWTF